MTKKVRVKLWGKSQDRGILIDARATEGGTVGKDIIWPDGSVVKESEIRGTGTVTQDDRTVFPSVWQLIVGIPQKLLNLLALTKTGVVLHQNNSFLVGELGSGTLVDWPVVKNSIGTGEEFTIPENFQLIVWDEFVFDGGNLTLDGDLIIL